MKYPSEYAAVKEHHAKLKAALESGAPVFNMPGSGATVVPAGSEDAYKKKGLEPMSKEALAALVAVGVPDPAAFDAAEDKRLAEAELKALQADLDRQAAKEARIAELEAELGG